MLSRAQHTEDTQWAFWDGMNEYQKKNKDYLQGQIGNPEGPEKPNKKYYDPRMSTGSQAQIAKGNIRHQEMSAVFRVLESYMAPSLSCEPF